MKTQEKSILLQKLEKQDLILETSKRYNRKVNKISEQIQKRSLLTLAFMFALIPIFLIVKPSVLGFFLPVIVLGLFYHFYISFVIFKRSAHVEKKEQRLLDDYILNKSKNLEILFEELSITGIKNVRINTVKNIIELKRENIFKNETIDPEDLLTETVNLTNKNKEKNVSLINY